MVFIYMSNCVFHFYFTSNAVNISLLAEIKHTLQRYGGNEENGCEEGIGFQER